MSAARITAAVAAGALILAAAPTALWLLAAGACAAAGAYGLRLERRLAPPVRRTPHRELVSSQGGPQ